MKFLKFLTLIIVLNLTSLTFACFGEEGLVSLSSASSEAEIEEEFDYLSGMLPFCEAEDYGRMAKALALNSQFSEYYAKGLMGNYQMNHPVSFQIGDDWNRGELQYFNSKGLTQNLVKVGSASGIYLGNMFREGREVGLIATNKHVVKNLECSQLELEDIKGNDLNCLGIHRFEESDLDFSFIEVTKQEIKKVVISFTKPALGTGLATAGRGFYRNDDQVFKEESSKLCQVLSLKEDFINMGCDSSPGDSGSGVFIRETSELLGLAYAVTKYIFSYSNEDILEMSASQNGRNFLSHQSSFMVTFEQIKESVDSLDNVQLSQAEKDISACLFSKGCLK